MSPRKPKSDPVTIAGGFMSGGGFGEAPQAFEHQSLSDLRFDESVELMRNFSLIDSAEGRRKVIALARLLASEQHDDHS